ncbi:acyltransferase family protein [Bradyrhizobium sp. CCBAU 51627]|uniref:acyltransferase family protein n=1 Tax=Bradyrhizobium sp. CCBAU 51627 TaxID=1325088 RepID=UPI0023050F2D|nr:acyltransferase [Bradyrhizobium sp. CCBAU 51627]MDA9435754.1 exopolysaccharide biosynthesis protein [Bradyrhizobium sp. CCBAU 51627]
MSSQAEKTYAESGGAFVASIQGLRGIAALTVLICHFRDMPKGGMPDVPGAGFLPPIWPWLQAVLNSGGHGVELFFMISGFLIPASLVRHASIGKFFYDRVLRIMPLFVILHLTLFLVGPFVGYKFFRGLDLPGYVEIFIANLFFLQNALGLPIAQQNAWTLTYEWAFYIWFALSFGAVVRLKNWWLAAPMMVLAVICLLNWPIAAFFGIGMLFSATNIRIPAPGVLGLVAGLICFVAMYAALDLFHPFVSLIPGFLLFGMVLAPGSGISAVLKVPPLQYLGKISYSFYLVHPFVLFPLQMIGLKLVDRGFDRWVLWSGFVILGSALVLIASAMTYEIIEVRFRRLIDATCRNALFGEAAQRRPA